MHTITWNTLKLNIYSEREKSRNEEVWERRTKKKANKQTIWTELKHSFRTYFNPGYVWIAHNTTTELFHFLFRWSEREESRKKESRRKTTNSMSFVIPNRTQRTRKLASRGSHICKCGYNQNAPPGNTLSKCVWGAHKTTTKPFHFLFRWSESRKKEVGEKKRVQWAEQKSWESL